MSRFPPSACLARVRRLEQAGSFRAIMRGSTRSGWRSGLVLFAEVTLEGHGAEDLARFDAAIAALPQIVEASHVSGAYDYLLKVVVTDIAEWTRIGEQLTAETSARIASTPMCCCASPRSSSAIRSRKANGRL